VSPDDRDVAPATLGEVDGRRRRTERSRTAVVDALLSLYDEGVVRPGAAEVAARAGVSIRSVFRHFDDLEDLAMAAIDQQWQRIHPRFDPPPAGGGTEARVAALVEQRLVLHAAIAGVARAAMVMATSSPVVASTLRSRRRLLGEQVTTHFASELGRARGRDRDELAAALEVTASLETVEYLRTHRGLDRDRAAAAMSRTMLALLDAGRR
jgi:AcrR family transcriptional regulator